MTEATDHADPDPEVAEVYDELEELAAIVDTPEERAQVRETMRALGRVDRGVFSGFRSAFDTRDAGEAMVGAFLLGIPMIVEDGTLAVGEYLATRPLFAALTLAFGVTVTLGILHAGGFAEIEADKLFGLLPRRLVSVLTIAAVMAVGLLTIWGRVDWASPWIALNQAALVAVVMAVGASIGDVLPE